ncbi:MAG: host attachment protein [Proteobacteria bacterium]|nr:host attachment protein [Pseudomonadota bacterium]
MTAAILGHDVWVAVCDGRKALLFQNTGDHVYPKLELRDHREHVNPRTSDQGSSPPGRTISSADGRHSAVSQTDFHDESERAFLKDFAHALDKRVRDAHIHKLVLVAPARALGMIRPALSPATQEIIHREFDRDYVKLPAHEIEQHLSKLGRDDRVK